MPWLPQRQAKAPRPPDDRPSAYRRGYTRQWYKAVAVWRAQNPERNLCVDCKAEGVLRYGKITDHIVPHKGDMEKFWDSATNWAAMCKPHHDSKTAREEGGLGNPVKTQAEHGEQ